MSDLQKVELLVPLGGGLAQGVAAKLVTPPYAADLVDYVPVKAGGYQVRDGYASMNDAGIVGTGRVAVATRDGQMLVITSEDVHRYNQVNNRFTGPQTEIALSVDDRVHPTVRGELLIAPIVQANTSAVNLTLDLVGPDVARSTNGLLAVVWERQGGVVAAILDAATLTPVVGPELLWPLGAWPRVVALGNTFLVVVQDTATNQLRPFTMDAAPLLAQPAWVAQPVIAGFTFLGTFKRRFDLISNLAGTQAHLLCVEHDPAAGVPSDGRVWLVRLNTAAAVLQTQAQFTFVAPIGAATAAYGLALHHTALVGPGGSQLMIATSDINVTLTPVVRARDEATYANLNGPTGASAAALGGTEIVGLTWAEGQAVGGSGPIVLAWHVLGDANYAVPGATSADSVRWRYFDQFTTVSGPDTSQTFNWGLAAKGFTHNGRAILPMTWQTPTYVATRTIAQGILATPYQPRATSTHRLAAVARFGQDEIVQAVPSFPAAGTGYKLGASVAQGTRRAFPVPKSPGADLAIRAVDLVQFDATPLPPPYTDVERATLIALGHLGYYDGQFAVEALPHVRPERPRVTIVGAGGPIVGIFRFRAAWLFITKDGAFHLSAPSEQSDEVNAAGGATSFQVEVPAIDLTAFDNLAFAAIQLRVWRTRSPGGLASGDFREDLAHGLPAAGTPVGTARVSTSTSEAVLATRPPIYTVGGTFANAAPPAPRHVATGRGRAWVASAERDEVWASKILRPTERTAPEFAVELVVALDTMGRGRLVGIACLEHVTLAFLERGVVAIHGDGLGDAPGVGTPFVPILLATDVGCTTRSSIVTGPFGALFQSTRGVMRITPNLVVEPVPFSKPAEDLFGTARVLRAVVDETRGLVLFAIEGATSLAAWHYESNQWMRFQNHTAADIAMWGDRFSWLRTVVGNWRARTPGVYLDQDPSAGSAITPEFLSAPIHVGDVGGFQRTREVHLIATRRTAGGARIVPRIDDEAADAQAPSTWTSAELDALRPAGPVVYPHPVELEVRVVNPKHRTIQAHVRATNAAGDRGLEPEAIKVMVAAKRGMPRLPAGARR